MKRRDVVALVTAFVLATSVVHAEDEIDPSAVRAEKLADDAHAKVDAGAYADAVELYLAAYKESPAAILLYDAAVVYDRHLGAKAPALEYYRRAAAAADLDEPLSLRAKSRITELEGEPPPSRGWLPLRIAGVATAGAGVLAIGAGFVLGALAKSKDDEAGTYCTGDRCTDARALSLTDDASGLARGANIAIIGGAVLLAGGVVMWLLAPSRSK